MEKVEIRNGGRALLNAMNREHILHLLQNAITNAPLFVINF